MKQPTQTGTPAGVDALMPAEMARRAEQVGVKKVAMPLATTFVLAVLGGAFIALGAVFATTVTAAAAGQLPYGVAKLLGGLAFCLGLILIVVAGAELFTGNNLIVMAWASGRVTTGQLLRNWVLVYLGNFVGAVATAVLMLLTGQYAFGAGLVGANVLNIAATKCDLGFVQAVALAIGCNALVCLAIWLCYSARTTTDKILSIVPPIAAFVTVGFEHCVANMYFIPIGLLVKAAAPAEFWELLGKTGADFPQLTWDRFSIANLLPVTVGNVIGGALMVGVVYWSVYLRKATPTDEAQT